MIRCVSNSVFLDDWNELYGVSMSKHDTDIEYLGTTTENPKNTQEDHLSMTPLQLKKSRPLSSPKSSIDSDLPGLDDPSVREKFSLELSGGAALIRKADHFIANFRPVRAFIVTKFLAKTHTFCDRVPS